MNSPVAGRLPAGIAGGMPDTDMVALGIDPRSIAGMDDAGLDVPATRIDKARDTVAALEGVTLPSAVDQVRRDTLKAMVGIHAGEKLPRDYARKARNKAMLDFLAAPPALRESMLADQIGLLMDGISDNGKRAVGAYTALKGKMKGIEAMNLPRLYDLKRELEGDVNMGWHRKRSFVAAVDREIENSTYRGDTPRAEERREIPYTYGKEPEKYHLEPSDFPDKSSWTEAVLLKGNILRLRKQIYFEMLQTARLSENLEKGEPNAAAIKEDMKTRNRRVNEWANDLRRNRAKLASVFQVLPLSVLEGMEKVRGDGFVGVEIPGNAPMPILAPDNDPHFEGTRQRSPGVRYRPGTGPGGDDESGSSITIQHPLGRLAANRRRQEKGSEETTAAKPDEALGASSGGSYQEVRNKVGRELSALTQGSLVDLDRYLDENGMAGTSDAAMLIWMVMDLNKKKEIGPSIRKEGRQEATKSLNQDITYLNKEITRYVGKLAHSVAWPLEYKAYVPENEKYQKNTSHKEQMDSGAIRGGGQGDVVTGAHRMKSALDRRAEIRSALTLYPNMDPTVAAVMKDQLEVVGEQYLQSLDMIVFGFRWQAGYPESPSLAFARKALGKGEYGDYLFTNLSNPSTVFEAITETVARNPGTTLAGAVGSVVAALVFPPSLVMELAVAAGGASLDAAVAGYEEYGNMIVRIMKADPDVDFERPETVEAFWANDKKRKELLEAAAKEAEYTALYTFVTSAAIGVGAGKMGSTDPRASGVKNVAKAIEEEALALSFEGQAEEYWNAQTSNSEIRKSNEIANRNDLKQDRTAHQKPRI